MMLGSVQLLKNVPFEVLSAICLLTYATLRTFAVSRYKYVLKSRCSLTLERPHVINLLILLQYA